MSQMSHASLEREDTTAPTTVPITSADVGPEDTTGTSLAVVSSRSGVGHSGVTVDTIDAGALVAQVPPKTARLVERAFPHLPKSVQAFLLALPDRARDAALDRPVEEVMNVLVGLRDLPPLIQHQLPTLKLPDLERLFFSLAAPPRVDAGRLGDGYRTPSITDGRDPRCTYVGPLLTPHQLGGWSVHPTAFLVQAFRGDYVRSKTYLQESEGALIAEELGLSVQVYTEDVPGAAHPTWQYGDGGRSGVLLYVNNNHYRILHEVTEVAETQVLGSDGRRFRNGQRTVADGNCLIDGLLMLAGKAHGPDEIADMRGLLQEEVTDAQISQMFEGIVGGMLDGEFPDGLGPETMKLLRREPVLWPEYERMRAIRQEQEKAARVKAEQEKADKEKEKVGSGKPPVPSEQPEKPRKKGELAGPAREYGSLSKETVGVLAKVDARPDGFQEKVDATRKLYSGPDRTPSTGAPHVFNKVFGAYADAMDSALAELYDLPVRELIHARDVAGQMRALMSLFEEKHRRHLVAHDLPPSTGADENSLAFGSSSKGLAFQLELLVQRLRTLTTDGTLDAQRPTISNEVDQIRAQMLHLVRIGIDDDAVASLTRSKAHGKGAAAKIETARQFVNEHSRMAAGGMIDDFVAAIERATERYLGSTPDPDAPDAKALGARVKALRSDAEAGLKALEEARTASKHTGRDPYERATGIVQTVLTEWGAEKREQLATESRKKPGRIAMAARLEVAERRLKRVLAHALSGRRTQVLPVTASPVEERSGKTGVQFSERDYPVEGSQARVRFAAPNKRNVAYADYETARTAALAMMGLAPGARPHARYSLGPGGQGASPGFDSEQEAALRSSDIRIEVARDQEKGRGSVEEGFVAEYITDEGPMLLVYHSCDCDAHLAVVKGDKLNPAPHFHVATLAGNDIDPAYWDAADPEDRTPQLGNEITASTDRTGKPIRTATSAKTYVQHETEHHLYHL